MKRAFTRVAAGAVAAVGAATAIGCSDPLLEPDRIQRTRVLAARVEVDPAPERAWPRPGEGAVVRWFVVDPGAARPLGWALSVCVAEASTDGRPRCVAAPLATATRADPTAGEPRLAFVAPDATALEGRRRLAVTGVVCPDAAPLVGRVWPELGCAPGGGVATLVSLDLEVASADHDNANPSLSDDDIELDGAPWAAPPALAAEPRGCATAAPGDDLPRLRADGATHTVRVVLHGSDREAIADGSLSRPREELQLSHFTTQGDLDTTFSVVEADDPSEAPAVTFRWTVPEGAPADGVRGRIHVVSRDLRGGADWTTREACLVP